MMDPDFYEDDESSSFIDKEEYVYDTYDSIFVDEESDPDVMSDLETEFQGELDRDLNAMHMGMAFALGEEIAEANRKNYEVDELTDAENMESVVRITALENRHTKKQNLRPFEQYVDDMLNGRRSIYED